MFAVGISLRSVLTNSVLSPSCCVLPTTTHSLPPLCSFSHYTAAYHQPTTNRYNSCCIPTTVSSSSSSAGTHLMSPQVVEKITSSSCSAVQLSSSSAVPLLPSFCYHSSSFPFHLSKYTNIKSHLRSSLPPNVPIRPSPTSPGISTHLTCWSVPPRGYCWGGNNSSCLQHLLKPVACYCTTFSHRAHAGSSGGSSSGSSATGTSSASTSGSSSATGSGGGRWLDVGVGHSAPLVRGKTISFLPTSLQPANSHHRGATVIYSPTTSSHHTPPLTSHSHRHHHHHRLQPSRSFILDERPSSSSSAFGVGGGGGGVGGVVVGVGGVVVGVGGKMRNMLSRTLSSVLLAGRDEPPPDSMPAVTLGAQSGFEVGKEDEEEEESLREVAE
eukprot:GHVS01059221.1.p1 GENE.GHVS01059221.1~~GHVS01059221.1.p1  ORF type:complete len:384 (+),score=137.04 GHVS01059221.1:36-1187(+)